jgi:hypothetical protein
MRLSGARQKKPGWRSMKPIEFEDGHIQVDAAIVAEGLGIALPAFRKQMQAGKITSLFERGTDADTGRHRLTFFSTHRRFRLVVDDHGAIVQRSTLDFGTSPLPDSVRKLSR